jgi:NADH-quinone oxidoreductase subunit N
MPSVLNSLISFSHGDGLTVLPEMELLLFALGILLFDFLLEREEKRFHAVLALLGVSASGIGLYMQIRQFNANSLLGSDAPGLVGFHNTVLIDGFFIFFSILFLAVTALVILLSAGYLELEGYQEAEFYSLILFACIGMMFMASGMDLIVLFLGIEIMGLSFYVLTGFFRANKRSSEASVKHFLIGAFGSAILAYGFSLLYGITRSTNIFQIGDMLDRRLQYTLSQHLVDWLAVLAFVTVAAGLFVKIAVAPFHQWAPDATEGAPTPISAYIVAGSILAGFALLLRLMFYAFGGSHPTWLYLVAGVAVVSIVWGNLAALTQNNLKRLLAYSSIAQAGFILLGLVAWDPTMQNRSGITGIFYYLFAYAFMTAGAFAVVSVLRLDEPIGETLDDLNGLYLRNPIAAVLLLVFMLSLAGVPSTAGFMGKYFIFQGLIESQHPALAVFAALSVLPGFYFYFRVITRAWMRSPAPGTQHHLSSAQAVALGITLFVTLAAGLYPEPFTRLARYAFGQ